MTAVPSDPQISELRALFKYLQDFRSVYEETGLEEILTPFGNTWSIWDLEYLYKQCDRLRIRQRQAITLCLVHGMREKDAAIAMGVSETNPVMMYATLGLRRLLDMVEAGELDRFRVAHADQVEKHMRRHQALHQLAGLIKSDVRVVMNDCWLLNRYRPGVAPRVRVRTRHHSSGILLLDPVRIMYEALSGPLPTSFALEHQSLGLVEGCINPDHHVPVITDAGKRNQHRLFRKYHEQTRRVR